ncbi:DUF1877 family protein [Lewinella sp. LCG006]|uniref:DUF1877 family protein n=1 Tax=Lewinella sp. LCG006 TaxID=3231911 RepID=UPI00345FB5A8
MGQIAHLKRIDQATFEEVLTLEEHPSAILEALDVDKNWDAIMYILGRGFIGREPTVNLFMPKNMVVLYEDEYLQDGIRYHNEQEISELYDVLKNFDVINELDKLKVEMMNKKIAYPIEVNSLSAIAEQIITIRSMFASAVKENSIIIGGIEY